MKYKAVTIFLLLLLPQLTFAQNRILDQRISNTSSSRSINEILGSISSEYGISFSWNTNLKIFEEKRSIQAVNEPLEKVLSKLLSGTGLKFKEYLHHIIIRNETTISGFIKDKETGETLIGANVYLKGKGIGSATNVHGFYSLTVPDTIDVVRLSYSFIGYRDTTVNIIPSQSYVINIGLVPARVGLDEVVVTAQAPEASTTATQHNVLNISSEQIKSLPAFMGQYDLLHAIQLTPGIKGGNDASNGIYVRGGGPDQNLVLLDGATVYNTSHSFNLFSIFNANAIKNTEIIKGGFPARFGGRTSSILNIRMKEGNSKKVTGEVSLGYLTSQLTLEGPIHNDKTTFLLSARRTFLDLLLAPLAKVASTGDTTMSQSLAFYDYSAKINHRFSDRDRIFVSVYTSGDGFKGGLTVKNNEPDYSTKTDSKFGLKWTNTTSSSQWTHVYNSKLFSNALLSYGKFSLGILAAESSEARKNEVTTSASFSQRFSSIIEDYSAKLDFDYYPSSRHSIKYGATFQLHQYTPGVNSYRVNDGTTKTDTTFRTNHYRSKEVSLYLEDEIEVSPKVIVNAGIHSAGLYVQNKFYSSVQPRISVSHLINETTTLNASYSSMAQFIHLLSNSTLGLPFDLWVPATSKVPPQTSNQVAVALSRKLNQGKYEVSVESYYKTMKGLIEYKPGANFLDSKKNWEEKIEVDGHGKAYGVETFFQKKSGVLTGWVGYTLSWTNRQFENINQGRWYPYKYDRRHDISVVTTYKPNSKVDLSCSWVFATGNATTFPQGTYPFADASFSQQSTENQGVPGVYYYGNKNSLRMPNYHRLDIGVNFHKQKKRGERTWNFSIYNAYGRKNPFFLFPSNDSQGQRVLKQVSMFNFVPSFSYSFKF